MDEHSLTLGTVVATLRAFVERAGAESAVLVLDQGDDLAPAVVDCPAQGAVEISEGAEGIVLERPDALAGEPLAVPDVRSFSPFDVDVESGQVSGPLGALDHLGRAVRDLAALFPGRSAVTVTFASSDPAAPLSLAARRGEPMVLALGEEQFDPPAGWPG